MGYNMLSPLQSHVLELLRDQGLFDRGYCLSGGTALSEFYLRHRYSDDLDFFTRKKDPLDKDFKYVMDVFTSDGLEVASRDISESHARFFLRRRDSKEGDLKVEFIRDVPVTMDQPLLQQGFVIDSFLDISVNKVCAILSRTTEPKDFCDLYFILKESDYGLDYLIKRASEKEARFDEEDGIFYFAHCLLAIRDIDFLPRMIKELHLEDLRGFFIPIGEKMIHELRPRGQ